MIGNDRFGRSDLLPSECERLFRDRAHGIDVVKINAFQFSYGGINVPWHGVSDAVDVSRMSISRHCVVQSSNGTARPPTACASSRARSSERLLTRRSVTPRETSARVVRSLVSPAPSTSTLHSLNLPKIRLASSTA